VALAMKKDNAFNPVRISQLCPAEFSRQLNQEVWEDLAMSFFPAMMGCFGMSLLFESKDWDFSARIIRHSSPDYQTLLVSNSSWASSVTYRDK
jgi:hypothetical protein